MQIILHITTPPHPVCMRGTKGRTDSGGGGGGVRTVSIQIHIVLEEMRRAFLFRRKFFDQFWIAVHTRNRGVNFTVCIERYNK